MRFALIAALAGLCGCSLLLDEDELVYDIALEPGDDDDTQHYRLYEDEFVEGRGAVAGSMPTVVQLNDIDIREGDELRFRILEPGLEPVTCVAPGEADLCRQAEPETSCCIGPFIGSDGSTAAAILRIGVFPQLDPDDDGAHLEIVRDGQLIGRGFDELFLLPERVLGDGTDITLDELNDFRPEGDEPYTLFSHIRLAGTVTLREGETLQGPARLVSTTTIELDQSLTLEPLTDIGGSVSTSPVLSGSTRGAIGLFAETIDLVDWYDYDYHSDFVADVVLLSGRLNASDNVDLNPCTHFGCESASGKAARLDVPSLCVESMDGSGCSSSEAALDDDWLVPAFAGSLEFGSRLTVRDDNFVTVPGDDPPTIELRGFGTYTLTHRTDEGTALLGTVSLGAGDLASTPELIQRMPVDVNLAVGRNRICTRLGDEPTPVRFDAPEGGTCVEVLVLP